MMKLDPCYLYYLADTDDVCLVSGEKQYTRGQLLAAVNANAKRYTAQPSDRVAILAENRPEWPAAFMSAWRHHAIAVPIDAMANVEDVAYILGDCRPAALFCSAKTRETAEKALAAAKIEAELLDMDTFDTWEDLSDHTPMPRHEDDELALFIYTSGTTSASKGCMLTFRNLEVNFKSMTEEVPVWLPDQVTVGLLPYHHIFPLQGCLLMPLMRKGCRIVFCPSMSGPDILKTIHDNKVTVFIAVPRVFEMFRDSILKKINANFFARMLFSLSKAVGNLRFSRLLFHSVQEAFGGCIRMFPTGGAALDYGVYDDLHALGFMMLPGSGMSETSPALAFTRIGKPRRDSAGQLLDIFESKIAEDGELLIRGESVFKGYWNKPEETAKAFTADGWFRTGDLCRIDEDKYLFYTGRKKELIILSNGKNVPPLVIEEKLAALSDLVAEVAVIASGDVLGAVIVPDFRVAQERKIVNIAATIRQDVVAMYNQSAEPYMRILKCSFVSAPLPRTRLGKLQRHKLAGILAGASDEAKRETPVEPDLAEYRVIRDYLVKERRCEVVRPDDHFEIDLGIDSLAKIEMMVSLGESFDAELTEDMLADHPTPRSLAEFIHSKAGVSGGRSAKFEWGKFLAEAAAGNLPEQGVWAKITRAVFRALFKMLLDVRYEGMENIPSGAAIFAANHQSFIDAALITAGIDGRTFGEMFFYAKKIFFQTAVARAFARAHNVIVLDLNSDIKGSLQKLAGVLKQGKKVLIFPEGARSCDGQIGIFKNTFAILGRELQIPVVPIAIDGAFDVLPRNRVLPRLFRRVSVTFFPAFVPQADDSYAVIAGKTFETICGALKK